MITPYGEALVDLLVANDEKPELRRRAAALPSIPLSARAVCDLELLAVGGYSPLDRFMSADDFQRVVSDMRLARGLIFPVPVLLPFNDDLSVRVGADIALRDATNDVLAVMAVEEVYEWDRAAMLQQVLGTADDRHPLVIESARWGRRAVSGPVKVLQLPRHHDFRSLRLTPAETRARLARSGYRHAVAFQTRNPLHRVHEELTKRAMERHEAALLLHPAVGLTKPGDVDHYTRVRTYRALVENYYDAGRTVLSLLPLAMWLAGPREALWHALIRRNYGASHFIVGRDHASPGVDSRGRPFYGPYDAQALVERFARELGITMVPFEELVYLPDEDRYEEIGRIKPHARTASISGTQVREEYLARGRRLPAWFTRPEVAEILGEAYPPRERQGICVWFTGLSGSGKSTTAEALVARLLEHGRAATLLDGDVVRTHLSKGLGFSREDRDANIRRIAYVASEVVRHGGIAICAAVSPYRATRAEARALVGADRFVEVFVDTPVAVCESRDTKGLYAKARRGELTQFTGIDDPYEPPTAPELHLHTVDSRVDDNAARIIALLRARGLLGSR
jgi:sulfate adenylyltransferase